VTTATDDHAMNNVKRAAAHNQLLKPVTASWVVAGIVRVTILSPYQSAVYNEPKYRRLTVTNGD